MSELERVALIIAAGDHRSDVPGSLFLAVSFLHAESVGCNSVWRQIAKPF